MGNIELLDKTRKINKLLHNNKKSKVIFDDMCVVMKDILSSNVICLSKKGKIPAATPFFSAIAGISYYFTVQEPATICLRRIMSNTFGTVSERTSAA